MRDPATLCSICLHVTQHGSGVKHTHAYAVSKTQRKRISSQLDNTCTLQGKRSPHAPDRSPHVFRPHVSDQLPTLQEHRANGLSPPSPAILPTQQRHRTNEALPANPILSYVELVGLVGRFSTALRLPTPGPLFSLPHSVQ
jgi:hypothetical protein